LLSPVKEAWPRIKSGAAQGNERLVVFSSCNDVTLAALSTHKFTREFVMRHLIYSLAAVALVAPALSYAPPAEAKRVYKEWVGKDGRRYCRRTDGTTGLIVGGVAGALVGRTIDTRGDRVVGTLGGAALGALAGREVERAGSRRRCVPR
jgi:Glycine zipper 2TM domain